MAKTSSGGVTPCCAHLCSRDPKAAFELRAGPVHVKIERLPGWLVAALATATGSGLVAYFTSR
ncbi:hypothetical protein [Streptomyces albidoflavus]|uniref:hypothetical protein n=1 Tax=Streptomyces albidoflavus TaxID=1886 RepID=UPI0033288EB6